MIWDFHCAVIVIRPRVKCRNLSFQKTRRSSKTYTNRGYVIIYFATLICSYSIHCSGQFALPGICKTRNILYGPDISFSLFFFSFSFVSSSSSSSSSPVPLTPILNLFHPGHWLSRLCSARPPFFVLSQPEPFDEWVKWDEEGPNIQSRRHLPCPPHVLGFSICWKHPDSRYGLPGIR